MLNFFRVCFCRDLSLSTTHFFCFIPFWSTGQSEAGIRSLRPVCSYHLHFQQSQSSFSQTESPGQTGTLGLFWGEGSHNSIIPAVNAYGNPVICLVTTHIPDELKDRVYRCRHIMVRPILIMKLVDSSSFLKNSQNKRRVQGCDSISFHHKIALSY